jgi:hypothetical protein
MADVLETSVTPEMLRDYLDRLRERGDLAAHPLTSAILPLAALPRQVTEHSENQDWSAGVARGLRAIWRQQFMPPVLSLERRKQWNFYFILEVMYFFPLTHGRRFPETLKDAAIRLCDEAHLARIVADGNEAEAETLLRSNRAFWAGFIPATMIPAEQTIHSRRNAAMAKLAGEITRLLHLIERGSESPIDEALRQSRRDNGDANLLAVGHEPDQPVSNLLQVTPPPNAGEQPQSSSEPLSANARRLMEAYRPALINSSRLVPVIAPPRPEAYQQVFLKRLAEQGADVQPAQLDELALWLEVLGFPATFGVKRSHRNDGWWWDDMHCQRALTERFCDSDEPGVQLQCAAALRQSSLTALIRPETNWAGLAEMQWVNALEAVADVARQSLVGVQRRSIALAVLARPEHARRLAGLGERYYPLLLELAGLTAGSQRRVVAEVSE